VVFLKLAPSHLDWWLCHIPLIRNEVVSKKTWLDDNEFMDMLAIAQSMPGPISLNTALFVGNKRLGFKGSLFSAAGIILPSFIVILFLAIVFTQFKENPYIERIFKRHSTRRCCSHSRTATWTRKIGRRNSKEHLDSGRGSHLCLAFTYIAHIYRNGMHRVGLTAFCSNQTHSPIICN